jgi:trans-2,3-dihydro-3-hydroxyanthranilate isomerase
MQLQYEVVDVFTKAPLEGNPLAVFTNAEALDGALMQKIAKELNLAETAFLLPATEPGCDVRVRIFTPAKEMQFAGHPTIGSACVARKHGLVPAGAMEFVLQENVGPVPVRVESAGDPMLWLRTPPISKGKRFDRAACARAVGLSESDLLADAPCEVWSAGNPTLFIALPDKAAVDRAAADTAGLRTLYAAESGPLCTFVFAATPQGAYSRMFAPDLGVPEDPATGSATGPLAAFMIEYGLAPATGDGARFMSEQGTKMGRRSELHIRLLGGRGEGGIEVGGYVAPLTQAIMTL